MIDEFIMNLGLKGRSKTTFVLATLVALGAIYTSSLAVHAQYLAWHDARYAQKSSVVEIQIAMLETDKKLDQLVNQIGDLQSQTALQAAATAFDLTQAEYDRHLRAETNTAEWRVTRDQLKQKLEQARSYRDCLINSLSNCQMLRGY